MGLFSGNRIVSWIFRLLPVILIAIALVCAYIPGGAHFLGEFFVNYLGEAPVFGKAVQLISLIFEGGQVNADSMLNFFLALFLNSVAETMIIACCVFAVKVTFMTLRRAPANTRGGIDQIFVIWRYPLFLLTAVGVALGVWVCVAIEDLLPAGRAILTAAVPMALVIYGIVMMFRSVGLFQRKKQRANTYGVFAELFAEIMGNVLITLCMVLCIVCLFVGPEYVHNGMPAWVLVAWYLLGIALICLTYQVLELMKPIRYTNRT